MTALLLYKIGTTMVAVLGLSFIAEKFSTRLAGLLAGYPIGTAIILHFYGLEYGAQFAADAAIFNLCGLLATQSFAYTYYRMTQRHATLTATSMMAIMGYLLPAFVISRTNPTRLPAVALAITATTLFCILFRGNNNRLTVIPQAWSVRIVAGRLLFTASLVVAVTEIAHILGPSWAGLFSAFPVTLYPLVFLLHRKHGPETAQNILKNFPYGLWSVIAYSLTVSLAYPRYGVIGGTLIGFAVATAVLTIIGMKPLLACLKSSEQRAM